MDLNHVAAFARVVHEGSFTAAAKTLGVPKSSVSRSVSQLEEALGVRLLHRTTRKLHLTEAGVAFYDRVSRALGSIESATSEVSELSGQPRGTVRVTAPLDLAVWALAALVARFTRDNPTISIDLALSSRAVDLAAEGFDFAVRVGPLRDQSLIVRRVGNARSRLYASRKYIARRGKPERVEELAQHDAILLHVHREKGAIPIMNDGTKREVAVKSKVSADDMLFLKKAALSGSGIALLPEFLAHREEASGKLVRVLPEWSFASDSTNVNVVYPSARFVPQRVVLFRDFVIRELSARLRRCEP